MNRETNAATIIIDHEPVATFNDMTVATWGDVLYSLQKIYNQLTRKTMKRHKEDALERVQRCARAYRDAVENLIATNPTLSESDLDTGEDPINGYVSPFRMSSL